MKVTVDQDKCVSSGQCVLNATDVFDQREDDGVVLHLGGRPQALGAVIGDVDRPALVGQAAAQHAGHPHLVLDDQ